METTASAKAPLSPPSGRLVRQVAEAHARQNASARARLRALLERHGTWDAEVRVRGDVSHKGLVS